MFKLSQETITIVTVGLTILGTILYSTGRLEDRIRADIQAVRAEARADREAWQMESARLRDDARADRDAWQTEIRDLRADAGTDNLAYVCGIAKEFSTA